MARTPTPPREPILDEPLNPPSASPAASDPAAGPDEPNRASPEAPGLGEQIGATRESVSRLVGAHVELAKAEFADIADAAKRAAIFIGIAIGAGLVAGLIVAVG